LLPRADYVFVSLPATPDTVGRSYSARLSRLKPGAGIINVGRASAMDYEALSDLLRSGHLSGAIIDVFDPEPLPPDSPLWTLPNCVLTPHDAGYSPLGDQRLARLFVENVGRYARGEPLRNEVRSTGLRSPSP